MDAYDELYVYTMGRKNFILQHVVDARMAQSAPAINPPAIGVIFALVGLYLHVDKGFAGTEAERPQDDGKDEAFVAQCGVADRTWRNDRGDRVGDAGRRCTRRGHSRVVQT